MNEERLIRKLVTLSAAPVFWEKGNGEKVVSNIEKANGRKLTDKEVDIAKAAWCHGFAADVEEVYETSEAILTAERGSTDD